MSIFNVLRTSGTTAVVRSNFSGVRVRYRMGYKGSAKTEAERKWEHEVSVSVDFQEPSGIKVKGRVHMDFLDREGNAIVPVQEDNGDVKVPGAVGIFVYPAGEGAEGGSLVKGWTNSKRPVARFRVHEWEHTPLPRDGEAKKGVVLLRPAVTEIETTEHGKRKGLAAYFNDAPGADAANGRDKEVAEKAQARLTKEQPPKSQPAKAPRKNPKEKAKAK